MKRYLSIIALLLIATSVFSQKNTKMKPIIEKIMQDQQLAWNKGDLDGFMSSYWNDDSLKFIGKNGITYGWKSTLDHYKKSYPDKATLGELTFTIMNVEKLKNHIKTLRSKHEELDQRIIEAYLHYDPDVKIKDLKIEKLQVKKEIEWLEKEISQVGRQDVEALS